MRCRNAESHKPEFQPCSSAALSAFGLCCGLFWQHATVFDAFVHFGLRAYDEEFKKLDASSRDGCENNAEHEFLKKLVLHPDSMRKKPRLVTKNPTVLFA